MSDNISGPEGSNRLLYGLERFVDAQAGGVHERALSEVRSGRKQSHWMWFVYPQLRGLGRSEVSRFYGIASLGEARAYLAHPILGPRLREAASAALAAPRAISAEAIFGPIDAMKLRSSMTLFQRTALEAPAPPHEPATPHDTVFTAVLARFFDGREDEATIALLGQARAP